MTTDPLHFHQTSLHAAGTAFASVVQNEDPKMSLHSTDGSDLVFAYNAPGTMDIDMGGDASSLAQALELGYASAEMQAAFAYGDVSSTLDKRPTTSYPASSYASMLRSRLDVNSGRRHSIQPLIHSTEIDPTWSDYSSMMGPNVGPRSMSLSVDPFAPFSYHGAAHSYTVGDMSIGPHDMSGSGFLMSPPRLTVSISSGSSPTPTPFDGAADDAKRRRTSLVDATPERAVQQAAQLQHGSMPQQTPPNMFAYQQHSNFSFGSSVGAGLQTPASVQSSISPCRSRRLSLTAVDHASHIAHLTANLGLPAFGGEEPPKSAPARAAGSEAMQQVQSQSQPRGGKKGSDGKTAAGKSSNSRKGSLSGSATASTGNGKNQDVWPDDVEVAFWEALRLIPKLGRRKVLVHGKPCGRNELIADYIERKTNKKRSRKQVSSHIQVLKNIRKGDPEFQQLIAEPTTEEDFYIPAGGMMYAQTLAGYGYGNLGAAYPLLSVDNANSGLLSPYTPGLAGGQGLASPLSPCPPPLSATHQITSGLNELHLPQQAGTKDNSGNSPCPILPASFSMWAHCSESDDKHVYTNLDRNSMTTYANNQSPLPQMTLDSVRLGHFRFPRLAEMYHRMPCQFIHVHVPLSVPRHDVMMPRYDSFSTQLSLTSAQDLRLTSVTTVYSHGKRVLSLVEPLEAPRKISGRSSVDISSTSTVGGAATAADTVSSSTVDESIASQHDVTTSTPVKNKNAQRRVSDGSLGSLSPTSNTSSGPASPCTPLDASKQTNGNLRHRWCHQAPFATDFCADFLSRNHPVNVYSGRDSLQSFGKEPSERAALGMAISGVTIIQELVVAGEGAAAAAAATSSRDGASAVLNDAGSSLSPGSKVGDVVLVVAWDLECVEALGATPGVPTVSLLTAGPGLSPLGRAAPLASPLHHPALAGLQVNPHGLSPMTAALPLGGAAQPGQSMAPHQQAQLNMLPGAPVLGGIPPANPAPSLVHTQPSTQPSFGLNVQPASSDSNVQVPTLLRKRGLSMSKPNLMLNIPPASAYLTPQRTPNGTLLSPHPQLSPGVSPTPAVWGMIQQRAVHTPITPFPQAGAGLFEPPPLNTGDDARAQKERLERHWAGQVNPLGGALPSPLDMSFNHGDMNAPSTSSAGMAVAAAVASPGVSALGLTVPSAGITGGLPLLSPAGFDMGSKTHTGTTSGPSSFEQMLNEGSDPSNEAITQEYLDGLLASIGVESQDFSSDA
ncbi:TEA/ATTS [Kalmanozyma brasiliensis GHG001]|nr:TEA/ATTS [Kalmanozyma brasiliensis GHG001]EST05130.2 TEA/ATTS [Kalmanozyma brasiliensis GHG001]